jgi:hypothetical protein
VSQDSAAAVLIVPELAAGRFPAFVLGKESLFGSHVTSGQPLNSSSSVTKQDVPGAWTFYRRRPFFGLRASPDPAYMNTQIMRMGIVLGLTTA